MHGVLLGHTVRYTEPAHDGVWEENAVILGEKGGFQDGSPTLRSPSGGGFLCAIIWRKVFSSKHQRVRYVSTKLMYRAGLYTVSWAALEKTQMFELFD